MEAWNVVESTPGVNKKGLVQWKMKKVDQHECKVVCKLEQMLEKMSSKVSLIAQCLRETGRKGVFNDVAAYSTDDYTVPSVSELINSTHPLAP